MVQWFRKYNRYQSVAFTQLSAVRPCPQPYSFLPPCFVSVCTILKTMEYSYQFFSSMEWSSLPRAAGQLVCQSWDWIFIPNLNEISKFWTNLSCITSSDLFCSSPSKTYVSVVQEMTALAMELHLWLGSHSIYSYLIDVLWKIKGVINPCYL